MIDISTILTLCQTWSNTLGQILEVAYDTRDPLLRMVSYQHLIWTIQAGKSKILRFEAVCVFQS